MANTVFASLDEFDDVFARNRIARLRAEGVADAAILAELALTSRDNSRTPMPWDDGPHAGFSTARPWMKLNPEYRTVNVARQQAEARSVLAFYRRLIALRRTHAALIDGGYTALLRANRQVYAYLREGRGERYVIIANLSARPARYRHRGFLLRHAELLLANHAVAPHEDTMHCRLQPFEARIYRVPDAARPRATTAARTAAAPADEELC